MFIALVKDRKLKTLKLIPSTEYVKTEIDFKNSLKEYYIVKEIKIL